MIGRKKKHGLSGVTKIKEKKRKLFPALKIGDHVFYDENLLAHLDLIYSHSEILPDLIERHEMGDIIDGWFVTFPVPHFMTRIDAVLDLGLEVGNPEEGLHSHDLAYHRENGVNL